MMCVRQRNAENEMRTRLQPLMNSLPRCEFSSGATFQWINVIKHVQGHAATGGLLLTKREMKRFDTNSVVMPVQKMCLQT